MSHWNFFMFLGAKTDKTKLFSGNWAQNPHQTPEAANRRGREALRHSMTSPRSSSPRPVTKPSERKHVGGAKTNGDGDVNIFRLFFQPHKDNWALIRYHEKTAKRRRRDRCCSVGPGRDGDILQKTSAQMWASLVNKR